MQTASIAELRKNLQGYLDYVLTGEEVLVKDQQRPIAKLVPLDLTSNIEAEELEMAAAGLVRLPETTLSESFWKMPVPRVSDEDVIAAVRAERNED